MCQNKYYTFLFLSLKTNTILKFTKQSENIQSKLQGSDQETSRKVHFYGMSLSSNSEFSFSFSFSFSTKSSTPTLITSDLY